MGGLGLRVSGSCGSRVEGVAHRQELNTWLLAHPGKVHKDSNSQESGRLGFHCFFL